MVLLHVFDSAALAGVPTLREHFSTPDGRFWVKFWRCLGDPGGDNRAPVTVGRPAALSASKPRPNPCSDHGMALVLHMSIARRTVVRFGSNLGTCLIRVTDSFADACIVGSASFHPHQKRSKSVVVEPNGARLLMLL